MIAPGFNEPRERYFVVDRHAQRVSATAGAESSAERLAALRDQLVEQRERIQELRAENRALRGQLQEVLHNPLRAVSMRLRNRRSRTAS